METENGNDKFFETVGNRDTLELYSLCRLPPIDAIADSKPFGLPDLRLCWLRSCYGLGWALFLLLAVAATEDKAEGKQTKHKRVFFRFGDDGVVDNNPQRAAAIYRKKRPRTDVIEGSCKEIANRFVQNAGAYPKW